MPFENGLPKYRELTLADKATLRNVNILNGCGPQSWRGNGPNWLFKANCFEHDYNYAAGGTEADRRWADWGFYQAMLKDTRRLPWWQQYFARWQAWIFYTMVRLFGRSSFNYKKRPETIHEMVEQSASL